MSLDTAIRYFTQETHILASMSAACGTRTTRHTAIGGIQRRDGTPIRQDSIFDLASLTKLLTGLLTMRLHEEGMLDLSAPVTRYVPQMTSLADTTVDQVLGFEITLVTPQRVDTQPTAAEGLRVLYEIAPRPNGTGRIYSDMHAMVLKCVLEQAAGQSYMELLHSRILDPLQMQETWCCVPQALRSRCVSCDGEHRLEKGRYILRTGIEPGTPHDPKARLLNPEGEDCCGHAGLFGTLSDMIALCQGVLAEQVVSRASLRRMAMNRTGRQLPDGTYTQYLGSQCYVKHPQLYFSEIPLYESAEAIGLSGFTGHHLSIDPGNGVFALYLGNRVMDRLSVLVPEEGKQLTDYGLNPDGSGQITWPDGTRVWSSVNYVHQKDAHFHNEVAEVLGL